jgi:transcriptional regulator with XRE-family HTH domain
MQLVRLGCAHYTIRRGAAQVFWPEHGIMEWSERIRNYRRNSRLSQEALAELFGVDVRSVRRWEAGTSRPRDDVRAKLLRAPVPAVAQTTIDGLARIISTSSEFTVLLDDKFQVIASSASYDARMTRVHGPDWRGVPLLDRFYKPVAEVIDTSVTRHGGLQKMMRNGLSAMTHDFVMDRDGVEVTFRFTGARLFINASESVLINTSFGVEKSDIAYTEPLITYLDEIMTE